MKTLLRRLWKRFLRHELWAIQTARRIGILSIFIHATLWIWAFLPTIVAVILIALAYESAPQFWDAFHIPGVRIVVSILGLIVGTTAMIVIAPWYFGWYFICVGLMFGKGKMAAAKQERVLAALDRIDSKLAEAGTENV